MENISPSHQIHEALQYKGTPEQPDIKIFVSHRIDLDSENILNPLLIPVRCGATFDKRTLEEAGGILGDDTGENISEKRLTYCELTVQYWAWKNVRADYYGLFHYRRFLNFSKHRFLKDEYGTVPEQYINKDSVRMYGLEEETMRSLIKRYDLILPEELDISLFPEKPKSMEEQWGNVEELHPEDLKTMLNVIARVQPEYYAAAKKYINGSKTYFCNMFIMKDTLFHKYCEWLFPIMAELEKEIDIQNYSLAAQRTVGHLGERLLGIYVLFLKEHSSNLRIKELQLILFHQPEKKQLTLSPIFQEEKEKTVVPVIFASSDKFAPVCAVTIASIIQNSSEENNYDIIILESGISKKKKNAIYLMLERYLNFSIRFVDAHRFIQNYELKADQHLSIETYYRFCIQDILPEYDKVLYLDSDIVCNRDVAELFCMDVTGYMLAAAHDPDVAGQMNLPGSDVLRYVMRELKLEDPFEYFQAGVLIMNLEEMRKAYSTDEWLRFAEKKYTYCDQDVLNRYCRGRVKYFKMNWNMMIDCEHRRVPVTINAAPGALKQEYHHARENPYIIHFAGCEKPWEQQGVDFEHEFWKYARYTPYYEQFLFRVAQAASAQNNGQPLIGVKGAMKIYIRKKANKWFPVGTRRRTVMKKIFGRLARRMGI